ncbi:MAG: SRPBCC family protein [Candidatus Rokuibacteriota bacterium]
MASIRREVEVNARPEKVWDAVRDVGAVHQRLAPGFVVETKMEEGARVVTFANGMTARELIVDVDDGARRLVWSVVGSPRLTHHNASLQVFAEGEGRSRIVWIADLLPDEVAGYVQAMIEQGMAVMQRALEK